MVKHEYETNTNDPDRFNLVVYATGQVRATDTKGLFYLTTRSSWRKGDDPEQSTYIGAQPELESFKLEWRLRKLPELPEGEKWADWVDLDNLRTTDVKGIYCEMQRPGRNDFNMQRHAYFHPEAQAWVELEGVYLVSNSEQSNIYYPEREQYDKDDVDRICVYKYGKCTNR